MTRKAVLQDARYLSIAVFRKVHFPRCLGIAFQIIRKQWREGGTENDLQSARPFSCVRGRSIVTTNSACFAYGWFATNDMLFAVVV